MSPSVRLLRVVIALCVASVSLLTAACGDDTTGTDLGISDASKRDSDRDASAPADLDGGAPREQAVGGDGDGGDGPRRDGVGVDAQRDGGRLDARLDADAAGPDAARLDVAGGDSRRPDAGPDAARPDGPGADGAAPDGVATDGAGADAAPADASGDVLVGGDGGADQSAPLCPSPGVASIGVAGGTLWSADCNAKLVLPANALTSATTLTMTRSASTPPGGVSEAYDIGPNGLVLQQAATLTLGYAPTKLLGATETKLIGGAVKTGLWDPLASSAVNTTNKQVTASLTTLSKVSALPGDATGPVANVLVLGSASGATRIVADNGGETPTVGVAINASSFPLAGKAISYTSTKPAVASVNATSGILTGGTLTSGGVAELVTITARETGSSIVGTAAVSVEPTAAATVVESGVFRIQTALGVAVNNVTVTHVQQPATMLVVGAGVFGALPALPAGSAYTLSFVTAVTHLPTFHTWWSKMSSSFLLGGRTYMMATATQINAVGCGSVTAGRGVILVPRAPAAPNSGWTYYVDDATARVQYVGAGFSPNCGATSTGTSGAGALFEVRTGVRWLVAKRGTVVHAIAVDVFANAVNLALFDPAGGPLKDGTTIKN